MQRLNWKLSIAQSHDARRALELIGQRPLTLSDCVRVALQLNSVESVVTSCTTATDQFLAAILRRGRREKTYSFYEQRLSWWSTELPTLDDWDRARLKKWLEARSPAWSPNTVKMTYRSVRALYGWALQQNPPLARANPCLGLKLDLPTTPRNVRFLTVNQVQKIVNEIPDVLLPGALVMLFAGVRPEEVAPRTQKPRLQWSHIDLAARTIRVPGDVAKVSGAARLIQGLPDTIWNLLRFPTQDGPVCPRSAEWLIRAMRAILGEPWMQDATRHTFATYAMAVADAGKVSEWLGHEGEISTFHRHYKGLVAKEAALPYWAIRSRAP